MVVMVTIDLPVIGGSKSGCRSGIVIFFFFFFFNVHTTGNILSHLSAISATKIRRSLDFNQVESSAQVERREEAKKEVRKEVPDSYRVREVGEGGGGGGQKKPEGFYSIISTFFFYFSNFNLNLNSNLNHC